MLVNIGGKPLSFFRKDLHFGNSRGTRAFLGIQVYRAIPELHADTACAGFITNYAGIRVSCLVFLHG